MYKQNNVFLKAVDFLEKIEGETQKTISEQVKIYICKAEEKSDEWNHDLRIMIDNMQEIQENPSMLPEVKMRFQYYAEG